MYAPPPTCPSHIFTRSIDVLYFFRQWFRAGLPFLKPKDVEQIVSKLDFKTLFVLRLVAYRADAKLMRSYLTSCASSNGNCLLAPTNEDIKELLIDMEPELHVYDVEAVRRIQ